MDVHATLTAPCPADELFALVDDLGRYPAWMDLVHRAEPDATAPLTWQIELRARIGPLARGKRLRMARALHDPATHSVRFERQEADGKRHSPWVLAADIVEADGTSTLHMHLHYGGTLWTGGVLERVLADQITNGQAKLLALVQPTR